MPTALLTGSKRRASCLDGTLWADESDIIVAESRDSIAALASWLPARSVGAYVQLLMDAEAEGPWAPPVTERIETVALVAPFLAPQASIVFVADDPADPAHDPRVADGLCLLAEAALSSSSPGEVTVSVVQEASPDAIARALGRELLPGPVAPLADLCADREYADWRTDMLNLTSSTDVTFFGWLNQEGSPRVGLLRGAVLSPLGVPSDATVGWGYVGPGAQALGSVLIAHTLGGRTVDDGLVELFVKDVIGSLPTGGFELSAAEVERWLRRQLGQTPDV